MWRSKNGGWVYFVIESGFYVKMNYNRFNTDTILQFDLHSNIHILLCFCEWVILADYQN